MEAPESRSLVPLLTRRGSTASRPGTLCFIRRPREQRDPYADCAAQYVRMSTEHQRYSIDNQTAAIAAFAAQSGLRVVRTFADPGCSGLSLRGRPALCALLDEVVSGGATFRTVLVLDISRWGRFQDSDESACYEFLCRRAGIRVEYCREQFKNDGSPMSSVVKSLKRIMAAEYSRELSDKVFIGKCRLVRLGFRQGGSAGYGLRHMVIDSQGRRRTVLKPGERKAVEDDRILLVPGPAKERRVVRWIFNQVARYNQLPHQILAELRRRGIPGENGKPWTRHRITSLLENEKYIGTSVYNKKSMKLHTPTVRNPREQWIRIENVFKPAVEPALFWRAQRAIARWTTRITNERALEMLKALYAKHGTLSAKLINSTKGMPGSVFYENRFGGLVKAFKQAGFVPTKNYDHLEGYTLRRRRLNALRERIVEYFRARGVGVNRENNVVMRVEGRGRLVVTSARNHPHDGRSYVQVQARPQPDWTLIVRFVGATDAVRDYWLARGGPTNSTVEANHRRRVEWRRAETFEELLDALPVSVA